MTFSIIGTLSDLFVRITRIGLVLGLASLSVLAIVNSA